MSIVTYSSVEVQVNNETIPVVPNSCTYTAGESEINVRSANVGQFSVSVHSINTETKIGMIKFDVYLDQGLDEKIGDWKDNVGGNVVSLIVNGTDTKTLPGASLTNNIERTISSDGVVSLEFSGDPMVAS